MKIKLVKGYCLAGVEKSVNEFMESTDIKVLDFKMSSCIGDRGNHAITVMITYETVITPEV